VNRFILTGVAAGAAVAATAAPMPVRELITYATIISLLGGIASGIRHSKDWFVLLQYGLNTATLGVSVVLMSRYWIGDNDQATYAALGAAGILSLGGLATVDWASNILRKWLTAGSGVDEQKK